MAEADNNLEDFFAKRDKKKKTGKNKKFDTAEDLAKILGKRTEERKKLEGGKSQYVSEDGVVLPVAPGIGNEDDEWIDAVEKQPDYTGLKIQELILDSDEEVEVKDPEIPEGTENAPTDGAWRKKAAKKTERVYEPPKEEEPESEEGTGTLNNETQNADDKIEASAPAAPVTNPTPVVEDHDESPSLPTPAPVPAPTPAPAAAGGKYMTPGQRKAMESAAAGGGGGGPSPYAPAPCRNVGMGSSDSSFDPPVKGAYVPPGRRAGSTATTAKPRKTVAAPNINDEEYFPSLGGS